MYLCFYVIFGMDVYRIDHILKVYEIYGVDHIWHLDEFGSPCILQLMCLVQILDHIKIFVCLWPFIEVCYFSKQPVYIVANVFQPTLFIF